jgi:hypothetical protein
LALRYARSTLRLTTMVGQLAIILASRTGAAVSSGLSVAVSRSTVLRVLRAPDPAGAPAYVLRMDDVGMRCGRRLMTVLIEAAAHRRVDVLPDRRAAIRTARWTLSMDSSSRTCSIRVPSLGCPRVSAWSVVRW